MNISFSEGGVGRDGETQFTGLKQKALSEDQRNISSEGMCMSFTTVVTSL